MRVAEQDRPDVAAKRRRWHGWQRFMDPARFVFLDETGTTTKMARRCGRSPSGTCLVAAVPHGHVWTPPLVQEESLNKALRVIGCCHVSGLCGGGMSWPRARMGVRGSGPHHWKTTTFIAGLRESGVIAPLVLDGPMTGPAFRAYVEQFLAPALAPGDVVVLDNLAAYKVQGIREALAAVGASLLYLPPYSPDLNPIEQLFAKLKALLRKAAARTRDALWRAIGRLLATVPPAECVNYLNHCGYGST